MAGLIGLDWGTSSLRAYLYDAAGAVLDARHRLHGVRALPEGGFNAALSGITEGWPACPRLATGMVGSRDGWHEMPYLDLPVDVRDVASALESVHAADGRPVHLVPGLRNAARPDVMRGEETQILGALASDTALQERGTLVLPGTHSKWVAIRDGRVVDFCTAMTGELFAVLMRHSILGAGLDVDGFGDTTRFRDGVRAARDSSAAGALSRMFSVRASMLAGDISQHEVPGWLSGLLIGEEVRAVIAAGEFALAPLRLVGDSALCACYRDALAEFEIDAAAACGDAAASGLWCIAKNAGLVEASPASMAREGVMS